MDANDFPAAPRNTPNGDEMEEEGELGELQEKSRPPSPTGAHFNHPMDHQHVEEENRSAGGDRWEPRRRSRSRSAHRGNKNPRSRSRSAERRVKGRSQRSHRSRSPHDRRRRSPAGREIHRAQRDRGGGRDRDHRDRDHHRGERHRGSRHSDRSRERGRRDGSRERGGEDRRRQQQRIEEEEKEDDEAFQARVAASLAAQEEDEDKIIEERRRRRQEILAKHQRQQQQQQQQHPEVEAGGAAAPAPPPSQQPAAAAEAVNGGENGAAEEPAEDENAMLAEMGTGEDGALDIWRQGQAAGGAGPGARPSTSELPSGIGEVDDSEAQRRLDAHFGGGGNAAAAAAAEEEAEEDMFAETPDDAHRTEKAAAKPARAGGGISTAAAAPGRGLVDSYDDAEGYYNFQVGEVIGGRYEVCKAHGRGVFSSVLRARDLSTASAAGGGAPPAAVSEVAIKVIRANETMYKAGQMEKVILRKLAEADPEGRRHCIRMLGSFEYRSHLCLVFEPMDMDLRGLTKRYGRGIGLSLGAVRVYTQQMLVALHHLRTCGVLHADIKPDNLLVNERRTVVKLCDFGSAMFAGDNQITPYLVSRFYRAPEVALGLPYDHPMDMWSVGCVVYELFTGQILFPGKSNNEMLKLMMDVKGAFPKRMVKRGEFAFKHFENDPGMTFALLEQERASGRPVRRLISNPGVKKDFGALLAGQDQDRKKLGQLADLLERMMALDPDRRITPKEALRHPFIQDTGVAPKVAMAAAPRAVAAAALKRE